MISDKNPEDVFFRDDERIRNNRVVLFGLLVFSTSFGSWLYLSGGRWGVFLLLCLLPMIPLSLVVFRDERSPKTVRVFSRHIEFVMGNGKEVADEFTRIGIKRKKSGLVVISDKRIHIPLNFPRLEELLELLMSRGSQYIGTRSEDLNI